ncbi:MAG TPA: ParA family protein [Candidatus Binataceae bacterium]|nr:ParA family protein [Candidatus Binataceae bacterium]
MAGLAVGRIVAIANQKGGVGKTTTAVNLAVALAQAGQRVLLVDLDPQGNATSGLTPEPVKSGTIYDSLVNRTPLAQIVRESRPALYLAPSSTDLVGAEIELATIEGRERRLRAELQEHSTKYNLVLIDTPPSLGLLTLNALVAADSVLVPMQCEYYALEGLSSLLATIRRVKAVLNPQLELMGVVLTMFDSRNRLSHEISLEVNKHFPERVFQSVIPRNVRISESPSHGMAVIEYDPKSVGAEAYRLLALELLERLGSPQALARPAGEGASEDTSAGVTNGGAPRRTIWNLRSIFARAAERERRNG